MLRAILSERQLQEVMTDFWFNHFNIYIAKDSDQWYTTSYEREAIRKHALGKFRDLLIATATSPAMMIYLDNTQSVGPNSIANGVNPANPKSKKGNRGLNENYGREVMELHTLGVDGGYSQADVTALSAILTGWSVDRSNQGGPFKFDPRQHEPGPKQWLGQTIASGMPPMSSGQTAAQYLAIVDAHSQSQMHEGIEALTLLAANPHTARFISYESLSASWPTSRRPRSSTAWLPPGSQPTATSRLFSVLSFNRPSSTPKNTSATRSKLQPNSSPQPSALRRPIRSNPGALISTLTSMGMRPYYALPPTGYYITADQWMNSNALVDRLNFAYALTGSKFANQKFDSDHVLALGLMAQPATPSANQTAATHHAKYSEAILTNEVAVPATTQPYTAAAGEDIALHALESTLIGADVSAKTNQLIHKQVANLPATNSTDTLNLLTALILGSPEFQLH